ncbi:MAG: Gfo/Idh/MocA family protein, partial [Eubacteriales bacterium]
GMGHFHQENWSEMENVEVVAVCDIIEERAQKVKEEFFPNATVYTDYKKMIDNEQLDAVDISTPNYLHSPIAVYALEHGMHVFCEKPDAVSVEEAEKMRDAAEKAGKVLMIMRNNRYFANSRYLKKYIDEGNCGEFYAGRCCWIRRRGIPGKGGWFTTKAQSGGGPLIDLGVHMIDLSMWLMGNPTPVSVTGCTYTKFDKDTAKADSEHAKFGDSVQGGTFDVEDLAMGFIKFDNGACLQIEFSWASNIEKETRYIELRGTKAGFHWNGDGTCNIYTQQSGVDGDELADILYKTPMGNGHGRNQEHFVDVVLNGAKPDFVPQQGINMIKILKAIYKSAETGKEVLL